MSRLRVFIVSQVRLYREGLAQFLDREPDLEVIGSEPDASRALARVREGQPDVALVDLALQSEGPALRRLVREAGVPVVVLGLEDFETEIVAWAEAGIAGYVTRDGSLNDLLSAVRGAARGELACSPRAAYSMLRRLGARSRAEVRPARQAHLTNRELEIVDLVDGGLTNKEIAKHLSIELSTVKNHMHNILDKLGVAHRAQVAAQAHRFSLGRRPGTRSQIQSSI